MQVKEASEYFAPWLNALIRCTEVNPNWIALYYLDLLGIEMFEREESNIDTLCLMIQAADGIVATRAIRTFIEWAKLCKFLQLPPPR